jgi:alkylation response protein AidB-like acyl-CoA dehydrogenase
MMTRTGNGVALSDEIIAHCGDRAAGYDRENRFFTEDFEELRAAGYLKIAGPKELGGGGMSLAEVCREQRRLAYRAPAGSAKARRQLLEVLVRRGHGQGLPARMPMIAWVRGRVTWVLAYCTSRPTAPDGTSVAADPRSPSIAPVA